MLKLSKVSNNVNERKDANGLLLYTLDFPKVCNVCGSEHVDMPGKTLEGNTGSTYFQ
jgi:hypothetical protein